MSEHPFKRGHLPMVWLMSVYDKLYYDSLHSANEGFPFVFAEHKRAVYWFFYSLQAKAKTIARILIAREIGFQC